MPSCVCSVVNMLSVKNIAVFDLRNVAKKPWEPDLPASSAQTFKMLMVRGIGAFGTLGQPKGSAIKFGQFLFHFRAI